MIKMLRPAGNFGFIRCADRPDDVFFSLSSVVVPDGGDEISLNINDECEFDIGYKFMRREGEYRLNASRVTIVPRGTVVWEDFDEGRGRVRGHVVKSARGGGRGGRMDEEEGTVRILVDASTNDNADGDEFLSFSSLDVTPNNLRLQPNDLIEFSICTPRRTKKPKAVSIVLIESERERRAAQMEEEMLASAEFEEVS